MGGFAPALAASLLAAILAAPALAALPAEPGGAPRFPARVVVAIVDTGINVYHEAFYQAGGIPQPILAELGIELANRLAVTRTGNYTADKASDAALWDAVRPDELYYFEGTRVLGISIGLGLGPNRILDDSGHGTAVAHAVLRANPEAIVVMVEGLAGEGCAVERFCLQGVGAREVRWVAEQPWIDILTTSFGVPFGAPLSGIEDATRRAVLEGGKLHFGAADNSPTLTLHDTTSGPWWSIGVAGFQEGEGEGKQPFSGTFPDFTSDWTQSLARHNNESSLRNWSGTSFASPRSAGVASAVVLGLREALHHRGGTRDGALVLGGGHRITNWDVRDALNETARVPALEEWQPSPTAPVPPQGWYALVGWGNLDPSIIPAAQEFLLLGGPVTKGPDAHAFMEAMLEARRAYWDKLQPSVPT